MELSIYDIIVGPVISDKAYHLNKSQNKLVLRVHPHANKTLVKEALEKLFSVKINKVNITVRKGKNRKVRGIKSTGILIKKAIVTLAEGHSLDLLDQAGAHVVQSPQEAAARAA